MKEIISFEKSTDLFEKYREANLIYQAYKVGLLYKDFVNAMINLYEKIGDESYREKIVRSFLYRAIELLKEQEYSNKEDILSMQENIDYLSKKNIKITNLLTQYPNLNEFIWDDIDLSFVSNYYYNMSSINRMLVNTLSNDWTDKLTDNNWLEVFKEPLEEPDGKRRKNSLLEDNDVENSNSDTNILNQEEVDIIVENYQKNKRK